MIRAAARWARTCEAAILDGKAGWAVALALYLALSIAGWRLLGGAVFAVTSAIMLAVLLLAQRRICRQLQLARHDQERLAGEQQRLQLEHYRQTEALFSLFSLIRPSQPLPFMGNDWSITPDLAGVIVALIRERAPALIVEAGSGVSTLMAAYALKDLGRGAIISLEHDERYWAATTRHIARHGLADVATVLFAPLREVSIRGARWLWYDTSGLEGASSIDMVIVDGPPGDIGKWARYPALPLLLDRLSDRAVVLLDDAGRQDEREIVEAWTREVPSFEVETAGTAAGAAIMRRDRAKTIPPKEPHRAGTSPPTVVPGQLG